ncbi:MAG: hypothetical protein ACD_28C00109G0002 [uncultured bacterium]|nr:MAG: hypothetical protein ACD_28C00109G0002 [uncultured bacterium]KKT76287.1 MAG: Transcriptional modulator of MazE/toxin, MazF [Candidatus Peregrinibacteria bacterium GW2011_GWA2_44_7]
MTNPFKLGEIYLVRFDPSVGKEYKKIRPGLIVQNENITSNYITVVPISSKIEHCKMPDILIERNGKNRLEFDSRIIVQQISSFDHSRFIKKIGAVSSPVLRQVRGYLRRHFLL